MPKDKIIQKLDNLMKYYLKALSFKQIKKLNKNVLLYCKQFFHHYRLLRSIMKLLFENCFLCYRTPIKITKVVH